MQPDTAVAIVTKCLGLYDNIRLIQFFGGEPLLNIEAIEAVCQYLNSRGDAIPRFVATTNGTLLNDKIAEILTRYAIGLTVSIDGPEPIHDELRPSRSFRSSHSTVLANIEQFRKLGLDLDIECTYTSAHIRSGISVTDLMDYFHDELGIHVPHIAWAYLPRPKQRIESTEVSNHVFRTELKTQMREYLCPEDAELQFREAAAASIGNIIKSSGPALSFVLDIADRLSTRRSVRNYCPAFNSQLSISTAGDVFPCFMFIGDPRMKMGNILSSEFPGPQVAEIWTRYATEFGPHPTGGDEWFAGLATGCVAGEYIASGSFGDRMYRSVYKAIIEEVLLGLGATANSLPA